MEMNRKWWEMIRQGDEIKDSSGRIAVNREQALLWKDTGDTVSITNILYGNWKLVKEEEKEIETEKWMRCDESNDYFCHYKADGASDSDDVSEVMIRKDFLRWGGTMPDGGEWPGFLWCLWVDCGENEGGDYWQIYNPKRGYTKQLIADYAEMRVEK